MKITKKQLWTDYPVLSLGDASGQRAPIRKCHLFSKEEHGVYVVVRLDECGELLELKRGYIYEQSGRCGEILPADLEDK